MNKLLFCGALLSAALAPAAAHAQALPAAVVAVVDLERVTQQCNACRTATATLRSQVTALQTRERTLAAPLETESRSLQTAVQALNGREPDAALRQRIQAFETRQNQARQELTRQQEQIQRNQAYIRQQISDRLGPIYQQVMQRRGATVLVERSATLATAASIDVSNDVVAALNAALTTIQTTAPAQQQQQPQGR